MTTLFFKSSFKRTLCFGLIVVFGVVFRVQAQWSEKTYGNEWIDYSKKYLRIQVSRPGLQRIPVENLPPDWRMLDPKQWELWYRGKQIPVLDANEKELIFLGRLNDGASDSTVYRPASSRLNPYQSLFSDQGIYFLTTSAKTLPSQSIDATSTTGTPVSYHIQKDTVLFVNQFSHKTINVGNTLNQSFYDETNSWTGPTIIGPSAFSAQVLPREMKQKHRLISPVRGTGASPVSIELLVTGLFDGYHDIKIEGIGPDGKEKRLSEIAYSGWAGKKVSFNLPDDLIDQNQEFNLRIHSVSNSRNDWFGVSYFAVTYPQLTDMAGLTQKTFEFPAHNGTRLITIDNTPDDAVVYNISDKYNPVTLKGTRSDKSIRLSVNTTGDRPLLLLVQSKKSSVIVPETAIGVVSFKPLFTFDAGANASATTAPDPAAYDYLMITNDTLKRAAVEYAQYRSSNPGGNHRVFLMHIRDIYDQFNYGEPSPVAIRSFMRHMLRKGIRPDEHNLVLLGLGVTYPPYMKKELPGEVPTFGDPGSDNLLVAGLNNTHPDLQAIPVGRIKAFNETDLLNYLEKVKTYEHETDEISWRKNVLHLSGGHSASEISILKNVLEDLKPILANSDYQGEVKPFVKTITTVEKVNITPEINEGAGVVSFFGHGSQIITDLDFGYVSDITRGYANLKRYPLMYFNGCGVGNIFTSKTVRILSEDWLLARDKGAIAIIANSYLSYISPSARHITEVYKSLFQSAEIKTIGKVLYDANKAILSKNPSTYDIANMHQAVLQGDPVLKLVRTELPDYLILPDLGIKVTSETPGKTIGESQTLNLAAEIRNGGKVDPGSNVAVLVEYHYRNGTVKTTSHSVPGQAFRDTLRTVFQKDPQLDRIVVKLDPENRVAEFSKSNNLAEISLDWTNIEKLYNYMPETDRIAPTVSARFDGTLAESKAVIFPSQIIRFELRDDRAFMAGDTTAMDIFIKPCWDDACEYIRLPYNVSLKLESVPDDNRRLIIDVTQPAGGLAPGQYQLLVQARDRAGNTLPEPFTLAFTVEEAESRSILLTASPNPASNYVKFNLEGIPISEIKTYSFTIFNLSGIPVYRSDSNPASAQPNATVWYWIPSDNVDTGIYVYNLTIQTPDGKSRRFQGKLSIIR